MIADDGSVSLSCPAPAAIQVRSLLNTEYGKTVPAHTRLFFRFSQIHTEKTSRCYSAHSPVLSGNSIPLHCALFGNCPNRYYGTSGRLSYRPNDNDFRQIRCRIPSKSINSFRNNCFPAEHKHRKTSAHNHVCANTNSFLLQTAATASCLCGL